MSSLLRTLWLAPFCLLGCSAEPPTYPVSGAVRLDGEALEYGTVRFLAEDGSYTASSGIGPMGGYELAVREGSYRVTVIATPTVKSDPTALEFEGGIRPGTKAVGRHAPAVYGDVGTTPLAYSASSDASGVYDIELNSQP